METEWESSTVPIEETRPCEIIPVPNVDPDVPAVVLRKQEPQTYTEALASDDSLLWKAAIDDEYSSLMTNETWTLLKQEHLYLCYLTK